MNHSDKSSYEGVSKLPRITLRTMTTIDIDPYCKLFLDVFSAPPWNENWTIDKINADIKKRMGKKYFMGIAAEVDSRIIGFLTGFQLKVLPSLFYIDQLFVNVNCHGNGVGRSLHSEMVNRIKSLGVSGIFLLTKPDTIAAKFYRNNGYRCFFPAIHIKGKVIFYGASRLFLGRRYA